MINAEELAICRKRGHTTPPLSLREKWSQCKYCGMWLRERTVIEEQEADPPELEQNRLAKYA